MSRFSVAAAVALGALALAGCGGGDKNSSGPDIRTFFPADAEVTGWMQAPVQTESGLAAGVQVGVGDDGASLLLDGAIAAFQPYGLIQLAMASYVKGSETLDYLRIWQVRDAASAYAHFFTVYTNPWQDVAGIGEAASIASTTGSWEIIVRKGSYCVVASISPASTTTQGELESFVQAVIAKIP